MIEKIQHTTASSPEGAKGLVKGVLACAFQNMAFMLPTGLLYLLVKDLLAGSTSGRSTFYLLGCVACFALIFLTTWFQYNGTYFTTYKESGTRRLTLAERLRKLPLSFFGKRDLADLTSTIMADCEVLEKDCSHFIPGLFGSLISTVLIALSLFAFDGRMALAALWVIPVSVAIVVGSYRVQDKVQGRTMAAKMACADGIQEYIETLRDLKASNAEQRYLSGLSGKIRAVEKQSIAAELETALFVSSAGMVLKLGIASVALTGSVLLVQGSINMIGYQAQVIPAMLAAFTLVYLERFFRKICPAVISMIVVPFCSLVLSVIIAHTVLGPIGWKIGTFISDIVYAGISGSFRVVFGAIFGFVYAPLVITGLHHMSNAIDMQLIADFGGTMLWPMIALSNIAQGSAVLGMIYLQRKNADAQEVNVSSCISCYLGVTEPAMFGVNLKFHFPFICGMIGSAIAAVVCVATSTTANAIGVGGIPGILSIQPAYMLSFALCMAIAIVVPFALTVIVGRKKGVA